MTNTTRRIIAGAGALALLAPAGALAKDRADRGQGKGRTKPKTLVVKGTVISVDAAAGGVTVDVRGGNAAARRLAGRSVAFDVSAARLAVADVDGDGTAGLGDVRPGDRVLLQVRAPRDVAADAPLPARKLVDLTSPPEDDDDQDGETPAPSAP